MIFKKRGRAKCSIFRNYTRLAHVNRLRPIHWRLLSERSVTCNTRRSSGQTVEGVGAAAGLVLAQIWPNEGKEEKRDSNAIIGGPPIKKRKLTTNHAIKPNNLDAIA